MIEQAVAKRIRLVGLDVDGTLTDGGLYIGTVATTAGPQPCELKRFDIQDGLGIHMLRTAGLPVVIITGRDSEAARIRAAELKVDEFISDPAARKLPLFESMLQRRAVRWEEVCFVGDDLPDLPLMRRCGLPVAVANATAEVRAVARHTTAARGGNGAVRECAEALLRARGSWTDTVREYLKERGDAGA